MKKLLSVLLCAALAASAVFAAGYTVSARDTAPAALSAEPVGITHDPDIINGNSYKYYTNMIRTYLCAVDGGYMRVYGNDNGTLLAEYYDSDCRFVSNRYISTALPMFGGFYAADGYYFVVTGDYNLEESDENEVIRVTRYDSDWNYTGSDSLYGANTTVPFDAARCAFASYGGKLIIRTAHEIYERDGINHQTNMTLVFDMKKARISDYFYDIANIATAGYLSHSFNQFVDIDDDGTVVCLDHGDAYPRSAALGRFKTKADSLIINKPNYSSFEYTEIMKYPGRKGANWTGAMLGGLGISTSSYITVGTAVDMDDQSETNRAYNAYYSVTDKKVKDLSTAETQIYYLTSFTDGGGRYASNPKLVTINPNLFLVMWNEFPTDKYFNGVERDYDENYVMKYIFIDGKGDRVTDIMTAPHSAHAYVTECEPIVQGSKVLWYVSDGNDVSQIVSIDLSGTVASYPVQRPEGMFSYPINMSKLHVAFRSFEPLTQDIELTPDNIDDYALVFCDGKVLERGAEYDLVADADYAVDPVYNSDGVLTKLSLKMTNVEGYSYFPMFYTYYWTAANNPHFIAIPVQQDDGVHLSVYAGRGVGYHIYRKERGDDSDYTLIATVNNRYDDEFIDTSITHDGTYFYIMREFTYDKDGNEILSDPCTARSLKVVDIVPPTEAPTSPAATAPAEKPTEAAAQPVLIGDVDGDYKITVIDATAIQRVLAGLKSEDEIITSAADTNGDGRRSVLDATEIQRYIAGLTTASCVGRWQMPA